ncbi:MAG: hypothetical protein R3228_03145 [Halioglobus sp.]|nr:hypothetical protein [Halioglobus sp.]
MPTLFVICWAGAVSAMPMLSPDGSMLTGVEANGKLYDVMFADGELNATYSAITFDDARRNEANAVSEGIISALNLIGLTSPELINGCDDYQCTLFNPEIFGPDLPTNYAFTDLAPAFFTPALCPPPPLDDQCWTNGPDLVLDRYWNTSDSRFVDVTLVTYKEAPVPATALLFAVGLSVLGALRLRPRRRQPFPAGLSR